MFKNLSKTWTLDPRLEKDTLPVKSDAFMHIRLMNDSRWPWLVLVPVLHDVADVDDVPRGNFLALGSYLHEASAALKRMNVCESTNVASIGNMVSQMHWHVIGRRQGDANWPGTVWNFGDPAPYQAEEAQEFIDSFKKAFRDKLL